MLRGKNHPKPATREHFFRFWDGKMLRGKPSTEPAERTFREQLAASYRADPWNGSGRAAPSHIIKILVIFVKTSLVFIKF